MADVVVDQKPMDKLPYDPNDIPDAVKKRAAAVERSISAAMVRTADSSSSRLERRSLLASSRRDSDPAGVGPQSPRRRRLRNLTPGR